MNPIKIGNKRELFWDDYLIDTALTNAYLKQHPPVLGESVMIFDKPWEGDGCDWWSIIRVNDKYLMYYLAWNTLNPEGTEHPKDIIRVCCLESTDGTHWVRPELELRSFKEHKITNILLDDQDAIFDNFYAFVDENPNCPPKKSTRLLPDAIEVDTYGAGQVLMVTTGKNVGR